MFLVLAIVIFVLMLKNTGRIGPFVWDPAGAPDRGRACCRRNDPEAVLAQRLANGDITPDEYLERLSLLQEK
ncbi:SHOCT domain-containing protein [Nigerium massiliense]|uniref:SHOCT domain-containing protein n=1 Tax=Nigerium massiliense TaxID=1522317 RepID=UPI00058E196A|nr:SHOCT domain-containing protein [Nigerium massiliense]